MREVGEFEMYVPVGEKLPQIGDTIETVATDDPHIKGEECTIQVISIIFLEWDMKKGGIIVHLKARYTVNKVGLRLAKAN